MQEAKYCGENVVESLSCDSLDGVTHAFLVDDSNADDVVLYAGCGEGTQAETKRGQSGESAQSHE